MIIKRNSLIVSFLSLLIIHLVGCSADENNSRESKEIVTWGHEYIGIANKETGKKIKVAVIDSGIFSEHEDLQGKVVESFNAINATDNIVDDYGHGTNIAGILTANQNSIGMIGVSQDIELFDVKVLNSEGKGEIDDILRGLMWAYEKEVDIINISFGFSKNYIELEETINTLTSEGIIVIASAGNRLGQEVDFPAKYPNVISVGSMNETGEVDVLSSLGKIDVFGPGTNIYTTNKDGTYETVRGTSFATAFITGAVAKGMLNEEIERSKNSFDESLSYLEETGLK
ncbi:S8 family peptidase [Bacillus altitudinis]|uniref:S8 family peptidase n=1 Tax=Bacillus altitudinis TaxID=293387 RepID=UPI003D9A8F48